MTHVKIISRCVCIDFDILNWPEVLVVECGTKETDWDYRPIRPRDVKRNKIKIMNCCTYRLLIYCIEGVGIHIFV